MKNERGLRARWHERFVLGITGSGSQERPTGMHCNLILLQSAYDLDLTFLNTNWHDQ